MQTLDVVNLMIGTMGEKPLSSLTSSHPMLAAALAKLDRNQRRIQAKGWWFNQEDVTLSASAIDNAIYIPNDVLEIRCTTYNLTARGNRIYNLTGGTFDFSTQPSLAVQLVRLVTFEQLPESAAQYVAAASVLDFQTDYDGDTAKGRTLSAIMTAAHIEANIEHTRNRRTNLVDNNIRLQRLKYLTRNARRLIRV